MAFVSSLTLARADTSNKTSFTPTSKRSFRPSKPLALPSHRATIHISMGIQEGERLPFGGSFETTDGTELSWESAFKNKKVVVVAIPGAFTSTCYKEHVPGFVKHAEEFKKLGADSVVCLAVNDRAVMGEFAKAVHGEGKVDFLADGGANFAKKIGLTKDTGNFGGLRSARYSALVSNGVVVKLNVDTQGLDKSKAETLLAQMKESAYKDPLELFCMDDAAADECRIYED